MIVYVALYRLAIAAYFMAIRMASLVSAKAQLFVAGRAGLLGSIQQALAGDTRPRIWMHCASLGEFEQGRPVLEGLRMQYPSHSFIVTFFSPSGYEVRKDYSGADHVFYLPMDSPANARRFLDIVQPSLCIFVKYELWYFYLKYIAARHIPALLLSAIFSADQGFFKWYGGLQRYMLRCFSHIFVQDAASVSLLGTIKITAVTLSGDTRFDRVIKAAERRESLPALDSFTGGNKILVAGSTWKEDEVMLHKALQLLPPDWKLVLVPHEVNIEHLRQIEDLFAGNIIKWSQYPQHTAHTITGKREITERVLLVDKVGMLLDIYRYGRIAWVGGGFGKAGVHNVLEPAVYGLPCYYGPIYQQFLEARELIARGGAFSCSTPQSFAAAIMEMEASHAHRQYADAAQSYVHFRSGATDIVISHIENQQLLPRPKATA